MSESDNDKHIFFNTEIAILKERISSNDRNLIFQAREYDRRIETLVAETERLRIIQESYLEKSNYSIEHKYLVNKIESVERMVYVGVGIVLTVQWIYHYLK